MLLIFGPTNMVTEKDLLLPFLVWLLLKPTLQSSIYHHRNANSICSHQCHQHGECHAVAKSKVTCECYAGWGGESCDIPCTRTCVHGQCVFTGVNQECLCSVGFRGAHCTEPGYDIGALLLLAKLVTAHSSTQLTLVSDPQKLIQANIQQGSHTCTDNFVCQNGGYCVNGDLGGYRCQCDESRHTGNFCQFTCPRPCQNGGRCLRTRQRARGALSSLSDVRGRFSLSESQAVYRCVCVPGFSGELCERHAEKDIHVVSSTIPHYNKS